MINPWIFLAVYGMSTFQMPLLAFSCSLNAQASILQQNLNLYMVLPFEIESLDFNFDHAENLFLNVVQTCSIQARISISG